MKVYILYFRTYGHGMFGSTNTRTETLGVYASEEGVKQKLAPIKESFLNKGEGIVVEDLPNGKGFSVSSMYIIPGWWEYKEEEVIE
jgi:hypothetical protein